MTTVKLAVGRDRRLVDDDRRRGVDGRTRRPDRCGRPRDAVRRPRPRATSLATTVVPCRTSYVTVMPVRERRTGGMSTFRVATRLSPSSATPETLGALDDVARHHAPGGEVVIAWAAVGAGRPTRRVHARRRRSRCDVEVTVRDGAAGEVGAVRPEGERGAAGEEGEAGEPGDDALGLVLHGAVPFGGVPGGAAARPGSGVLQGFVG